MPRTSRKTLSFPVGGVVRKRSYREQTNPFSSPWAVNVRSIEPKEDRGRGGSRPGLISSEVTEIASRTWLWENGDPIEWEGTPPLDEITYDLVEPIIETVDGQIISPSTIINIVAEKGNIPEGYTINCFYRDRVVIGFENIWYASRVGKYTDWDYGADMNDESRAVAGTVELAGRIGNDITAIIPHRDQMLIIATSNSLHVLQGDPATGTLQVIDENVGIIAPYGYAFNGDTLAFLSNDGVYIGAAGSKPERFSEVRIPDELRNVDVENNIISMAYDPNSHGFFLFITPETGRGNHYFLEMETRAIWPIVFGDDNHQPVLAAKVKSTNLERVFIKGRDEEWREFREEAVTDDGTAIESHVLIGPIMIAGSDDHDAMLAEIHGLMSMNNLPESIIVSGAGISAVNGVYNRIYNGTRGLEWEHETNPISIYRLNGDWVIKDTFLGFLYHSSTEDVNSPLLVETWISEEPGYDPVPILSRGDPGQSITWRIILADSAEEAADNAVEDVKAAVAGGEVLNVVASGMWGEGRNSVVRPRSRGMWLVIWLSSETRWAYEAIALVARQFGRTR